MVPLIITIVLIAVIRCEEKHYFIPTALRFDDSLYYNENDKANYLFVDFQKLAIYNLCYNDNNYTEVQSATEKTTITFCKTGHAIDLIDLDEESPFHCSNKSVQLSITNVDDENIPSNDIVLSLNCTPQNNNFDEKLIHVILKCNKGANAIHSLTKVNNTYYIISGGDALTCGYLFSFQSTLYRNSGFFGYFLICFSFFNQVYGYNNQRFAFAFYGIYTLIRILGEILDIITLSSNILILEIYVILFITCLSILGMIFGIALSTNFIYKKVMISFLTGDILYNFLFYIILMQFSLITTNWTKCFLLLGCIVLMGFVTFIFVKEEEKHQPLIIGAMTAGGSYFFLLGMKFISGGFPFEHAIIQFNWITNYSMYPDVSDDKDVFSRMKSIKNFIIYPILFVVWWLIGIAFMISSKKEKEYLSQPIVDDNKSSSTTERD